MGGLCQMCEEKISGVWGGGGNTLKKQTAWKT